MAPTQKSRLSQPGTSSICCYNKMFLPVFINRAKGDFPSLKILIAEQKIREFYFNLCI